MNRCFASAMLLACAAFIGTGYAQNQNPGSPSTGPGAAGAPSQSQGPQTPGAAHAPDAQTPGAAGSQQPQAEAGSTASVTGCLTKGSDAGSYVITDQKTGDKYPFSGPAQLDKFVNQTVKLSGAMTGQGADKMFKPDRIAPVATTCEKAQ